MYFVPEGQQIVAWHEVPGTASPQKIRPVGYGLILARGAAPIRRLEGGNFECGIAKQNKLATWRWRVQPRYLAGTRHYFEQQLEHHRTQTFEQEYSAFLEKHGPHFDAKYLGSAAPDRTVPSGTALSTDAFPGTSCQATISLSLRDKKTLVHRRASH